MNPDLKYNSSRSPSSKTVTSSSQPSMTHQTQIEKKQQIETRRQIVMMQISLLTINRLRVSQLMMMTRISTFLFPSWTNCQNLSKPWEVSPLNHGLVATCHCLQWLREVALVRHTQPTALWRSSINLTQLEISDSTRWIADLVSLKNFTPTCATNQVTRSCRTCLKSATSILASKW